MESIIFKNEYLNAKEILYWAQNNPKLYVNKTECPIKNYFLYDIVFKDRNQEEKIYLKDEEIYSKIRRGNCIMSYNDNDQISYKFVRKGLIKFFDLYLNDTNQKIHEKIKTLGPVESSFNNGKKIVINFTEKANGENVQISYEPLADGWIIGSKNVTLLFRNRTDILFYKDQLENGNRRFSYCIEFAEVWSDLLEKDDIIKNNINEFKKELNGLTMIGELVGDANHEHIKLYQEKYIVFYSIVINDSNLICLSLNSVKSFCDKYGLRFVNYTRSLVLNTYSEFRSYMEETYKQIFKQDVETGGEGSVAYISEIDTNKDGSYLNEKIISICKLKTFEYKFLRKIRDKIEAHFRKKININSNTIGEIEKDCLKFLVDEEMSMDISKWIDFGKFILSFVRRSSYNCNFTKKYATFISEMKNIFHSVELITDQVINDVSVKYMTDSKDKKEQDNISHFSSREINPTQVLVTNKIYFLACLGLIAGGKSTLFSIFENIIEEKYSGIVNLLTISSDKMKGDLAKEYLKQNPETTLDIAFEKTAGNHKSSFKCELEKIIKEKRDYNKINIFFVDKNFPADHITYFHKDVSRIMKKSEFEIIMFYPVINYPINQTDFIFPFSLSYFIQCYLRLKNRKNHHTLDFEKNSNAHFILLCFFNLYKNIKSIQENISDIKNSCYNIKFFPVTFHDENEIFLPNEMNFIFKEILDRTENKFEIKKMEGFKNIIEMFFSFVEKNYQLDIFRDTKEDIKIEIQNFISSRIKH